MMLTDNEFNQLMDIKQQCEGEQISMFDDADELDGERTVRLDFEQEIAKLDAQNTKISEPKLVHCKDCKYYQKSPITGTLMCFRLHDKYDNPVGYNWSSDDFCSRGIHK